MKVIILAGGSGTRLWPLSRTHYPKQFLKLEKIEYSIFQYTLKRALKLGKMDDIFFVTNKSYYHLIAEQIEELGLRIIEENILVEPEPKNTLPAVAYAVKMMNVVDSEVIAVLPSDQMVDDVDAITTLFHSAQILTENYFVTFGIRPTSPETGYGYIKPGNPLGNMFSVDLFKEKPNLETAQMYVSNGYFWNSGMFLFRKSLFTTLVQQTCPSVANAFLKDDIVECFKESPNISIDYGLLEKSSNVAVAPYDGDWSDLGSFTTLYAKYDMQQDECGNVFFNDEIMLESTNNMVYADSDKAIALIGINDLIIVDQRDALLVCRKEDTQRVGDVVSMLKNRGDSKADYHITEYRPWGYFTILESSDFYKVKRLTVLPQKRLSYQMHHHRSEHWIVVEGTAEITIDDEVKLLFDGESVYIPTGSKHRLKNPGKVFLEIIEVQSGHYLGEDDIVRFEDDYSR